MHGTNLFRYMQLLGEEENVHPFYRGRDLIYGWVYNYIPQLETGCMLINSN